jgi:UDP-glucose 6-dehydrogenase
MKAIFGPGSVGRLSAACFAKDGERLAGVDVKAAGFQGIDAPCAASPAS